MGTVRRVVMWVGLLVGTQVAVGQAPAPSISSLSVTSGITGTAMTINGANFGSSPGTVTFNSVAAGVSSWSSGSIGVTVPAAATSGNVVVSVNGVASNGVRFTVVPNISGLLVNGVGSTVGPVGATLTIQGTGFGATLGFSTATLNGIALAGAGVKPVNWSNSSIVAVIPSTASSGPVKVTVGGKASNLVSFAIGPVITGVAPGSGVAGSSVMLSGNGFGTGGGTVTFNGLAAVTTGWTDSSITSQVPRGATAGAVVVTVNGVASNGVGFTPTPVISGLSPASGVSGTSVQIQGSSLGNQQGTSTVSFNGVTAPVVSWSNSTIQVTAPGGGQSGPVVVAVNGVQSAGSVFTYTPVITGLVPNSALAQTAIQIQGSNFGQTQGTVTFNGVGAGVSHWSNTSITATVPGNATAGPVVVTVNGVASNGVGFTFPAPYTFSVSYAPDGNVLAAQDSVNGNWSYGYDDFNRLITATNSAPQQGYSYAYDRYGNRWQQNLTAGSGSSVMATFTGAGSASSNGNCYHGAGPTNQPDGYCYDAAGNMLWDGQHHYTYDGENRIIAVDGGQTASYVYDGGGQRIRKVSAAGTADYVYDLAGHAVTEVSGFGQWNRSEVYANGRHLATYNNGTTYFTEGDWLGTERARVLASGELVETCTSLPFGDALECNGSADPSPHHLTGKERDTESGLDYFGARYYANALGIFVTPDPVMNSARPANPQSWNRYSYVANNPLRFRDPAGLWQWDNSKCGANEDECKKYKDEFRKAVTALQAARDNSKEGSADRKRLDKVLALIGKEDDKGKLHVGFDDKLNYKGLTLSGLTLPNGRGGINMTLNFAEVGDDPNARAGVVGHETQHGVDERGFFKAIGFSLEYVFSSEKRTQWEAQAFRTESSFYHGAGVDDTFNSTPLWNNSWAKLDAKEIESKQSSAARKNAEQEVGDLKKKQE